MKVRIKKLSYDKEMFPFRDIVSYIFDVPDLENIHLLGYPQSYWIERFEKDVKGNERFYSCYEQFLKIIVQPLFDEKLTVQRFSNFRIQFPGNMSIKFHLDSEYGCDENEMNVWLPLTLASGSNSIYIESEPGKKDYSPQEVNQGEFLIFPGSKLSHGTEINTTSESRLSLDFRVIKESLFIKGELVTMYEGNEISFFKSL